MKCEEFINTIDIMLSEEHVNEETSLNFKHHLKNCKSCRESYEHAQLMVNSIKSIPLPIIPKAFILKTLPLLKKAYEKAAIVRYYQPAKIHFPVFGAIASVLSIVFLFVILFAMFNFVHSDVGFSNIKIPEFTFDLETFASYSWVIAFLGVMFSTLSYFVIREKFFIE